MSNHILKRDGWQSRFNLVGDYEINEEIGRGTFASVYRGYNTKTNEQVAIKVILKNRFSGKILSNIESEIRILRKLKHPNIVSFYGLERVDDKIYLMMELCSFGDLSDYIKKGKNQIGTKGAAGGLNEIIFRHFLKQLASSFKFLRKHDLVHRDLKPQNILLSPPKEELFNHKSTEESNIVNSLPQLKVADFGFAKILPTQTLTDTVCGSPLYMAPEILQNFSYDATADLWSIGAVLYEMITGNPPFTAKGSSELLRIIINNRDVIKFPGDRPSDSNGVNGIVRKGQGLVSDDVKDLIRSLLVQDPLKRLNFEEFFNHPAVLRDLIEPIPEILSRATFTVRAPNNPIQVSSPYINDVINSSLRKSSSLSTLKDNQLNGYQAFRDRRVSTHIRTNSNLNTEVKRDDLNENQQDKSIDDEPFDNDYVLIDTENELKNLDLNKKSNQKRSDPVTINPSSNPLRIPNGKSIDSQNTLNALPKTILGVEINDDVFNEDSPPEFGIHQNSHNDTNGNENVWNVGSNAASTLAKAISLASMKLFGNKGLSPPAEQYRADKSRATPFPLSGPSISSKESVVINEIEQVALQAYYVSKFANTKLEKLKAFLSSSSDETNRFDAPIKKSESDISYLSQDTFLLYSKALSLLQKGYAVATEYWEDNSDGKKKQVSPRLFDAIRWLKDKFNECLEKAHFAQNKLDELNLKIINFDTDSIIYHHAMEISKDVGFRELIGDDISASEESYKYSLWLLKSIFHRTDKDINLSSSDEKIIRTMIGKVEDRISALRKKV